MKKFILRFIIMAIVIFGLLNLYSAIRIYLTYKDPWGKYALSLNGSEVFKSIYKSRQKKNVKKLIIGDSVSEQIYSANDYNDSIYSLSCNQAITMAGQYCLLKTFLEINKEHLPKEVIVYYNPFSLQANLDRFAFHYFLKTFYYTNEYQESLDEECVKHRVKQIPQYRLAALPLTKSINWSPKYQLPNENKGSWCSPITLLYLHKIENICKEYNIPLRFTASFIKENRLNELTDLYKENDVLIKKFVNTIVCRPTNEFIDDIHFKHEYIPQDPLKLKES